MKKIVTPILLLSVFVFNRAASQTSTETVNFDNYTSASDNDLVNWFSGGSSFSQITTNGVSGGCVVTPDSVDWGNGEANYCFKYKGGDFASNSTRFSFKYDSTLTSIPSYARCASIWLKPSADFNHYIVASVTHGKKLQILSYSWTNNLAPTFSLTHGNWYQLVLFLQYSTAGGLDVSADLFDLGPFGMSFPNVVDHESGSLIDSVFCSDTAVQVGISGSLKGGAQYIDDFKFIGQKSSDSCAYSIPIAVNDLPNQDGLNFYSDNSMIHLSNSSSLNIEIINLTGEIIFSGKVNSDFSYNTSALPSGVYFLIAVSIRNSNGWKFFVN